MKRLIALFGCVIVLSSAILAIAANGIASATQQQPSGPQITATADQVNNGTWSWVNVEEIDFTPQGQTTPIPFIDNQGMDHYWNSDPTGGDPPTQTYRYVNTNTCGGQKSTIWANPYWYNQSQSSNHANVVVDQPKTQGVNCSTVTINAKTNGGSGITIQHTENANIFYEFSGDQIVRVDGAGGFTFVPGGKANIFVKNTQTSSQCPDTIYYQPGGNSDTTDGNGLLWTLSPAGSSTNYPPPPTSTIDAASGCVVNGDISDLSDSGSSVTQCAGQAAIASCTLGTQIASNSDGSDPLHIGGTPPKSPGVTGSTPATSGSGAAAPSPTGVCQPGGINLSWFLCPIINAISSVEQDVESFISGLLATPVLTLNSNSCSQSTEDCQFGPSIYQAWSNLRVYGDILLVVGLLIAVFVEAFGGGVSEAYAVKRMLPRILIAAILINLSIYLVAGLEDITNVLGQGVFQIIHQAFTSGISWPLQPNGVSADITSVGAVGTGALILVSGEALAFFGLFVLLPALFALIAVFFTIVLRQGILLLLLIVSPIAFALYCLPNTEQYFKKWWDLLLKTLMVYPIMMLIFAAGDISYILMNFLVSNGKLTVSGVGDLKFIPGMLPIMALIAPLFLMPFAFRLSGGAIGSIYSGISSVGKKATEAIKGNPNDPNSLRNKTRRRVLERATRTQGKLIGSREYEGRPGRRAISKAADLFGNADDRIAKYNKAAAERKESLTNYGNDDLVFAGAGYTLKAGEAADASTWTTDAAGNRVSLGGTVSSKERHFNAKGKQISSQLRNKGHSLYGGSQHDVTQGLGYTIYKAQTDNDVAAMQTAFNKNAEKGKWSDEMIEGNWLGATYPYKGVFGSVRYSSPKAEIDPATGKKTGRVVNSDVRTDQKAYKGMIKDMHKTRKGFQLSEIRDQDWKIMYDKQRKLEQRVAANPADLDAARDLAMTYEIFDGASQKLRQVQTSDEAGGEVDNISAGGATPAAQPIIQAAVNDRAFNLVTGAIPTAAPGTVAADPLNKTLVTKAGGIPTTTGFRTEGDEVT